MSGWHVEVRCVACSELVIGSDGIPISDEDKPAYDRWIRAQEATCSKHGKLRNFYESVRVIWIPASLGPGALAVGEPASQALGFRR